MLAGVGTAVLSRVSSLLMRCLGVLGTSTISIFSSPKMISELAGDGRLTETNSHAREIAKM